MPVFAQVVTDKEGKVTWGMMVEGRFTVSHEENATLFHKRPVCKGSFLTPRLEAALVTHCTLKGLTQGECYHMLSLVCVHIYDVHTHHI